MPTFFLVGISLIFFDFFILHAGSLPINPRKYNLVEKEQEKNLVYVAMTLFQENSIFC